MRRFLFLFMIVPVYAFSQELPPLPFGPLPTPVSMMAPGEAGSFTMPIPSTVKRTIRQNSRTAFDLQGVSVAEVIQMIYGTAFKTPYVLSPEVLQDTRPVSFRWSADYGSLDAFLLRFLDSLGYKLEKLHKVDFITKFGPNDRLEEVYIYRPKFRSVNYLSELIGPMLRGSFSVSKQVQSDLPVGDRSKGVATSTNALGIIKRDADTLVYRGVPEEIHQLKSMLAVLDIAGGEVLVRGLVYEVGFNKREGSAFSLITSLFDGSLKIGVNTDVMAPGANFLSFKNITIDFIANILSTDSRFNVVSSPSLRIRSGEQGRFNVGQDVPVLGSIMYSKDENPVQSVEYRSSGVIFNVRPQVYEEKIDLDIDQQISNFIKTDTGVNVSPTLTKRQVATSVSLADNEIIVLGGLAETKDSMGKSGFSFFPDFLKANTAENSRSEIILVLQVTRL